MNTSHSYTPFRKPAIAVSLAILAVMLVSCNLPSMLAATATPLPTPTPQNTATLPPPTQTAAPTMAPSPTATATPTATNIVFGTGMTAAVEQGSIQPNQVQAFTLDAGQYQPMILIVSSPNNDVYLGVTEPDGNILLDPAKKWTNWQWLLPQTEVYTIKVYGGATTENYTLTTKVAQIITFPSGATSVTLGGSTPKGYIFSYALSCKANQSMTVSINVPASSATLDVFGLATGPLLNPSAKSTSWTGTLPADEDYIIEVIPNGTVVNYTLTVTVK
jgi:hypothetical protein